MDIKVLYFANFREAIGISEELVNLETNANLATLTGYLVDMHPALKGLLSHAIFSVNRVYSRSDVMLNDADEVAIFPPIAGG